jgi:hypothetical protein
MSIRSFITKIDSIGIEPNFTFSRQSRYKTFLGGFLTILLGLLFLAGFFYFGRDVYAKLNPTLLQSRSINLNPKEFEITPTNFPFYIALENNLDNLNYFKDPTVFTVQAKFRNQVRYIDQDGVIKLNVTSTILNVVDCDLNYHFPGLEDQFNTTAYQNAYCLAPNQTVVVDGDFPNDVFNILQFNLFQCFNTTTKSNCKPQSVIDSMIKSTYVAVDYGSYIAKPANFTNPMERTKTEYFTTVSNYNQKQINLYLKRLFHTTDEGFVFEDLKEVVYTDVDYVKEFLTTDPPLVGARFLQIGIRMSYTEDYTNRTYLKIQTVLANVGGLFKFFSLTFEMFILFFTKEYFYLHLINENFSINDKDKRAGELKVKPIRINNNSTNIISNNTPIGINETSTIRSVIKFNSKLDLPSMRNDLTVKRNSDVKILQSLDRLNDKLKEARSGNKLYMSLCNYVKIFYCKSVSKECIRYREIYKKGKFVVKNCIDVNYVIAKLIEYEKLKQIVLDKNQLYMFDLRPNFNIENVIEGEDGGCSNSMSRLFFKKDAVNYLQLHEAFNNVRNNNRSKKGQRLFEFYDKKMLGLLNSSK